MTTIYWRHGSFYVQGNQLMDVRKNRLSSQALPILSFTRAVVTESSIRLFVGNHCVETFVSIQNPQDIPAFGAEVHAVNPYLQVDSMSDAGYKSISAEQPAMASSYGDFPPTSGRAEVKVRRYKNEKQYEREARLMLAAGWHIEGQSGGSGKVNMGRTVGKAVVLLPWAFMRPSRKGDTVTVTWVR